MSTITGPKPTVKRRRPRPVLRASLLASWFALILIDLVPTPASASTTFDVRGSWSEVATVGTSHFPQTITYTTEDFTSGAVTGTDVGGGASYTVTGIIDGATVTTDIKAVSGAYASHTVGTLTRSGATLTMAGTFTDNAGHHGGTFTATLTSPAAPSGPSGPSSPSPSASTTPKAGATPSATMVICNRDLTQSLQAVFLCNAFVADASGGGSPNAPTGTVTWTDTVGAFARGTSCLITIANAGVAGCSIPFKTTDAAVPIETAPPVTASYSGDATFAPSQGSDQLGPAADLSQFEEMSLPAKDPQTNPVTSAKPNCDCGDPIDPASGNLALSNADIVIPGRGAALAVVRTYNAASAGRSGRFGAGWTGSYDSSLERTGGGVIVHLDSGASIPFAAAGADYIAPAWVTATLHPGGGGSLVLRFANQNVDIFDATGRLSGLSGRTGEVTQLTYNGDGALATATDTAGRVLQFVTDAAGRVTQVNDSAGRAARYLYDSTGDLVSVTDVVGHITAYRYDAQHHLTGVTNPHSGVSSTTYDSSGRVVKQTDPLGNTLGFAYAGRFPNVITTVTDGNGHHDVYAYRGGLLVSQTAGAGTPEAARWNYVYDAALNVIASLDPNGHLWRSTYDAAGNVVSTTDPLGREVRATYDGHNNPTRITDQLGLVTEATYDDDGMPTRVVHAAGTVVEAVTVIGHANPAHAGDVTSVTDPLGAVTTYAYDASGAVATVTDAAGGVASATYDAVGHAVSVTGPRGHIAGAPRSADTTTSTSDAYGNPLTSTDALGNVTTYRYDADQNLTAMTDAEGRTVTTTYDADDRPVTQTAADGSTQRTSRDAVGNVISQTDATGHVTTMTYDALNRMISWTDPLGHTWHVTRDGVGNVTSTTDATGATTRYAYDSANQLVTIIYDDKVTAAVSYTYDGDGRRLTMTDGTGRTTYEYDAQSRLISTTDGAGHTVRETYDLRGGMTSLTYPDGLTVGHTYDVLGRLTAVTDGAGHTNRFTYNADSRLVTAMLGNGIAVTHTYDNGNALLSTVTTAPGSATPLASFGYTRDPLGRVATVGGTTGSGATKVTYDAAHRLASLGIQTFAADAAGNVTALRGNTQTYNTANQLTATSGTANANFSYDQDGRRITAPQSGGKSMNYRYDQAGRLTGIGESADTGWRLWIIGVIVLIVAAALIVGFRRRRTALAHIATVTAIIALVVAGIPVTAAAAASPSDSYTYNGDGLRVSATDTAGHTATFAWQQTGATPLLIGDGVHRFVAGPGGLPLEQIDGSGRAQWLSTDQQGSVRAITDTSGAVAATFDYDGYGLLTSHTGNASTPLGFDGQYTDADTQLQYLQARYYDPATAQFLTVDPMVMATHHPYAFAADNPLSFSDPSGADPVGGSAAPAPAAPVNPPATVLAGHGAITTDPSAPTPMFTVPPGTTVIFHQPFGSTMTDAYGVAIEKGQSTNYSEVYGPGSVIPDYTLGAPDGLAVQPTSVTVTKDTQLSTLIKPNMGKVDWAACRDGPHKTLHPTWPQTGVGLPWDTRGPILNYRRVIMDPDPKFIYGEVTDPSWWGWDTTTPLPQA